MGKTQAEKDAAKQAAKAAVAERKAVHAAALDTPLAGDEAANAGQTAGVDTTAAQESGQAGEPKEEGLGQSGDAETSSEHTPSAESADSVASLAAEGLRDGGSLSDDEVQRVSGAVLAASDDEADKVDDAKTAALIAALTERVEQAEILIGKLESKVADLEKKLYKIGKDARITVKDDSTLHGKIDDLRM